MEPTRPPGGGKIRNEPATTAIQRAQAQKRTSAGEDRGSNAPTTMSDSMGLTRRLVDETRMEVKRVDAEVIQRLKEAIAEGTFEVRTDALADRLVDDSEGLEFFLTEDVE